MSDPRVSRKLAGVPSGAVAAPDYRRPSEQAPVAPVPGADDTRVAVEIRQLIESGEFDRGRERFAALVASQQRRALRIAFQYLRDAADADEAVQDAFVKAFAHITSYREAWPFEVWFTRI